LEESRPRYGFTVIASARSSAAAYCRVVLPMSARLASKRTGTSFPWAYAIVSSNARQPSASS